MGWYAKTVAADGWLPLSEKAHDDIESRLLMMAGDDEEEEKWLYPSWFYADEMWVNMDKVVAICWKDDA